MGLEGLEERLEEKKEFFIFKSRCGKVGCGTGKRNSFLSSDTGKKKSPLLYKGKCTYSGIEGCPTKILELIKGAPKKLLLFYFVFLKMSREILGIPMFSPF